MNALQTQFHNTPVSIIDHNGKKWLTSEQAGLCLGYGKDHARTSINKLYARHADEFSEMDTTEVKLTSVDGKFREARIFSDTGCIKLGFLANTRQSKDFRQFACQVLAGQSAPMPAPVPAEPATVENRLDNLEQAMVKMAGHMQELVAVSNQQAQKLDVTSRYISLLEINQKGTVKITRTVEASVLALKLQGMPQSDIARLLRISRTAVNHLWHGKYTFAESEKEISQPDLQALIDNMIAGERTGLIEKLGG